MGDPYRTPGERPLGPRWGITRWVKWWVALLGFVRPPRVFTAEIARLRRAHKDLVAQDERIRNICRIDPANAAEINNIVEIVLRYSGDT